MHDPRLTKLADLLVNYSTGVRPGDWVVVMGDLITVPLIREVSLAAVKAGGNVNVLYTDGTRSDIYFKNASDAQLEWVSPFIKMVYEDVDVLISFWGSENTRAMSNVDPTRTAKQQAAMGPLFATFLERLSTGAMRWVGSQFPAQGDAQEAEMSLSEYEDFVFNAMLLNCDDPIAEWRKVEVRQEKLVAWLKGKQRLTVKSANCDLSMPLEGRQFKSANGKLNMPDGEIYTSPVEKSVEGWVRFTYPAIYGGRSVEGVALKFEQGKVVEASASKNEEFLLSQLDLDEGARYLGEFAIGTNFGIPNYTGNTLFDEKIGGTVHMALGRAFPEIGGTNESAVHWDMVCDMRGGGEIHVDGELFYKDGQFVV